MITTHGGRFRARPPSGVAAMDELRPPHRGGPPWLSGARSRTAAGLPWVSTVVLLVFVMVGTGFAEEGQGRRPLDPAVRLLLFVAVGVLLLRRRRPWSPWPRPARRPSSASRRAIRTVRCSSPSAASARS
ncbi:hypothetical protein GCM10010253_38570 [Streptomyces badius]|uniref:Uncharacterized protein n=1 Tax=Streptomyces badius TaxID=1941 RepID=A0ABQ2TD24_STRBA|nr:hypothetical protein GCM10010253_38570 [Streptomyces badius]